MKVQIEQTSKSYKGAWVLGALVFTPLIFGSMLFDNSTVLGWSLVGGVAYGSVLRFLVWWDHG